MGGDPISVAMEGLRNEDRASLDRRVAANPKARRLALTSQIIPRPNATLWSRAIGSLAIRSDAVQVPLRKVGAKLRWSKGTCTAALRIARMEPNTEDSATESTLMRNSETAPA